MSFRKTTARSLAAAIALVLAGGTVAGAAVLHLPILGFGRAPAAVTAATRPTTPTTARTARPRVVVRTRYVDDIVHRPAPRTTLDAAVTGTPTAQSPAVVTAPPRSYVAPVAVAAPRTTEPAHDHEDEHGSAGARTNGAEGDD